ncbi:MAG: GPR endopeptidase [Defluviitaleaceae bacterium]|nr:GPR endopeptidase [Defluviitaleaceae bacterium]MCL2836420.1 GPR endopeptidase [Defluviitaleaceae bacterium]
MSETEAHIPLFYTDLAMEAAENLGTGGEGIPGVRMELEDCQIDGGTVKITRVFIEDENGAKALGKPVGTYVTAESASMKQNDIHAHEGIIKVLVDLLAGLEPLKNAKSILIVGLGNRYITPDALGPRVVSKALVTRYFEGEPAEDLKSGKLRYVCAVAPGVLGTTGIETGEIIKGITQHVKPDVVIAVDALAARSAARVNTTVQFTDTGLSPGSGMGTGRTALNVETLGVPVIAIGVPTVVDAATLVNDTLDLMLDDMIAATDEGSDFYNTLKDLGDTEKYGLIKRILDPYVGAMFVTPKDVDTVIDRLSNIIANALNIALHPGIGKEDINRYMY